MFIIGKKVDNCDEVIRSMVSDSNIKMINDYFNNYYEVCCNDQELKVKTEIAAKVNRTFQSACFSGAGMLPYLQFARFNSLANEVDKANDEVSDKRKELELSLFKLDVSQSGIKDSDIYERLDRTHNAHANSKCMNPYGLDITAEDNLLDLVLNNELDLIKDFLSDYRTFNFDVRLAKKRNTSFINHDINKLDLRLRNLVIQNELLKEYQNSDVDACLVYGVINESYSLLNKSLNDGVTKEDINNYEELFNFDINDISGNSMIEGSIKKYIDVTKNDILRYGKVNDNNKKKVK